MGAVKQTIITSDPERVNLKMEDKFAQHTESEVKGYWISLADFWIACPCVVFHSRAPWNVVEGGVLPLLAWFFFRHLPFVL